MSNKHKIKFKKFLEVCHDMQADTIIVHNIGALGDTLSELTINMDIMRICGKRLLILNDGTNSNVIRGRKTISAINSNTIKSS